MKRITTALVLMAAASMLSAESPPPTPAAESQIVELERQWAAAIQRQDAAAMTGFLADEYFLAIGVQGGPLKIVPRAAWLDNLKNYVTKSWTVDDQQVHVYGDTAVVLMLASQEATVGGQDRSAQFVITDIWVKGPQGWRVAERHSSRPEPARAPRP